MTPFEAVFGIKANDGVMADGNDDIQEFVDEEKVFGNSNIENMHNVPETEANEAAEVNDAANEEEVFGNDTNTENQHNVPETAANEAVEVNDAANEEEVFETV